MGRNFLLFYAGDANHFIAAPRHLDQTDWEILALQPADSTLQLQSTLHDPINSRLVDSEDAKLYFDLLVRTQNSISRAKSTNLAILQLLQVSQPIGWFA